MSTARKKDGLDWGILSKNVRERLAVGKEKEGGRKKL
jgi:hypothetical protein